MTENPIVRRRRTEFILKEKRRRRNRERRKGGEREGRLETGEENIGEKEEPNCRERSELARIFRSTLTYIEVFVWCLL